MEQKIKLLRSYKGKRFKKHYWYTLCIDCFMDLYKQGGWRKYKRFGKEKALTCSFCGGKSLFEFYPHITHQ